VTFDPHYSALAMPETLYARLNEDVNVRLRRGAWYKVLKLEGLKAVLEVNGRHVLVASALLQIVKRPPPRWTVVTPTAGEARKAPAALAGRYGVCPSCSERAALANRVRRLRCPYCKYEFEVAWDEAYLT
jgi:hypothetical protein